MNLVLDFPLDDGAIKIYIPQPPADRVEGCVEVFSYVFRNLQKLPAPILAKDLEIIIKKLSKDDPSIATSFNALMQEIILTMKPVNPHEGQELLEGLALFEALDEEEQELFKAIVVFQYALMRYASQKIIKSELSEFVTALSFKDYQKHFLKSIEEMEKKSLKKEEQED